MRNALFAAVLSLALATLVVGAQDTRSATAEGFEFPTTTPVLKYNFPRKALTASVFTGTWIAETVEGVKPDLVIDKAEVKTTTEALVIFTLTKPETDWPVGLYRLDIHADGRLVHSERFVIR